MTEPEDPPQEPDLPPEPPTTGAALVQREPSADDAAAIVRLPEGETGIRSLTLAGAITRLLDGGIKGSAAMMLLQVSTEHVERDLERAREESADLRREAGDLKDALHGTQSQNAVLRERLSSEQLKKAVTTVGGIVVGVAAPSGNVLGVVLGGGLMLMGWLWPRGRS